MANAVALQQGVRGPALSLPPRGAWSAVCIAPARGLREHRFWMQPVRNHGEKVVFDGWRLMNSFAVFFALARICAVFDHDTTVPAPVPQAGQNNLRSEPQV
jgi:hypothetical protein